MALESAVFPQELFGCTMKDLFDYYAHFGQEEMNCWERDVGLAPSSSIAVEGEEEKTAIAAATAAAVAGAVGRKKRRLRRSCKNKEEVENQRMAHIAVERNRRKLMNDYLGVLRSMMPSSYAHRCDQASIVGAAINFVKELEQLLRSLDAQRRQLKLTPHPANNTSPFSNFLTFPHYYNPSSQCKHANDGIANETVVKKDSAVADIDVTMVERHINLKILSRQHPKQLLKMVVGLQNLRLTILHLSVNTVDQTVLYSFSLKVEDDSHLASAENIAAAVYGMVCKIQEEAV